MSTIKLLKQWGINFKRALLDSVADRGQNCSAVYYRHNAISEILKDSSSTDFPGSERIEIWKYDPARLAKDGYVDPLSLALCYKNDSDERVQGEIKRFIERTL